MNQSQTAQEKNEDIDKPIKAYVFESQNTKYKDSWGWPRILDFHPDEIKDLKYRNLIRVVPVADVEYDNPTPIATEYLLDGNLTDGTSEHVDLGIHTTDNEQIVEATHLAPIKEDRDVPFTPKPVKKEGNCRYFINTHHDEEIYYRVSRRNNEAQKLVVKDGTYDIIPDQLIARLWEHYEAGMIEEIPYEETPFSDPAKESYRNIEHF